MRAPASSCPYCMSPLVVQPRPYIFSGLYLGRFQFLVCTVCARVFHPSETSSAIEVAARAKGIFPEVS